MEFKPNDNFVYYLYFIKERMNIFWRKLEGQKRPWTDDPILDLHKFTNVYRMLDRSSQYLISNVLYNGVKYTPEDIFWRVMVYKHFNLPNTWDYIIADLGDVTSKTDLFDISDSVIRYEKEGGKPYSNAYMLTAAFLSGTRGKYVPLRKNKWKKHQYYFYIYDKEIRDTGYFHKVIMKANNFKELFESLLQITSMADFLSYQIAQDLNYSEHFNFDMNQFNAAGLGTVRGIERTFDIKKGKKFDYGAVPVWVYENFDRLVEEYSNRFDLDLKPDIIKGYPPQVPDLSNCFCETDKYLRGVGVKTEGKEVYGKRIKNQYIQDSSKPEVYYEFPPKWNISLK